MEQSSKVQQSSFFNSYVNPLLKAGLGLSLAAGVALGSGFVLQKLGFSASQIHLGAGSIGVIALAAYAGGGLLGAKSSSLREGEIESEGEVEIDMNSCVIVPITEEVLIQPSDLNSTA